MAAQSYGESGTLLSQGPIAPCYYFFGPVDILKDEAIAGLLDRALDPGLRDFNLDQRSASQSFFGFPDAGTIAATGRSMA